MARVKADRKGDVQAPDVTQPDPKVGPGNQALAGAAPLAQQQGGSAVDLLAGGVVDGADPVSGQTEEPDSFGSLFKDVEAATTPEDRQAAALALTTWARGNLTNQADIQAYLARADVTADTKTAVLGQLQALLARNEFLLGTIFHGGVDQSWETKGANTGPIMDWYMQQSKLAGQVATKDAAWCTSFVGAQALRAGFDAGDKAIERSMFWSGSRLETWAKTGKATNGAELNPAGDRPSDSPSGAYTGGAEWGKLGNSLTAAKDDDGKQAALDTFLADHEAPQAGDIVVIGEGGNAYHGKGNSHTLMVESYNPTTGVMSLIEGNSDNRVKGRTLSLRDPADVGKIIHITRLGAENFDDPGNKRTGEGPGAAPERQVTAEQLLNPVREANAALAALAVKNKWVKGTDPNASVSELYHGSANAKDEGGTTR